MCEFTDDAAHLGEVAAIAVHQEEFEKAH